jgi:hypothetical protein
MVPISGAIWDLPVLSGALSNIKTKRWG